MTALHLSARARRTLSAGSAGIMSLVVAGTALAATWQPPIPLANGDQRAVDVVTLSSSGAVAVYEQLGPSDGNDALFTRRSTTGGQSWSSAVPLTDNGIFPAISGRGSDVDVVWNSNNGRVHYAHSSNGGISFKPAMTVSPRGRFNWRPAVGRGPGGVVAISYVDAANGDVSVRVSHDGGATFDPRDIIFGSGDDQSTAVAVGDGVIYVAYTTGFSTLLMKRSHNEGATWTAATTIATELWDTHYSIAAASDHAYIAFEAQNPTTTWSRARYRRTLDSGAHWSAPASIARETWTTHDPDIGLANGVLRATFVRCTPEFDICVNERVYYRQSGNGTSWGTAQRVSPDTLFDAYGAHVGAHRPLVVYIGETSAHLKAFSRAKV